MPLFWSWMVGMILILKSAIFTIALPLQREVILCWIGVVHSGATLGSPVHGLKDLTSQLSELIQLLICEWVNGQSRCQRRSEDWKHQNIEFKKMMFCHSNVDIMSQNYIVLSFDILSFQCFAFQCFVGLPSCNNKTTNTLQNINLCTCKNENWETCLTKYKSLPYENTVRARINFNDLIGTRYKKLYLKSAFNFNISNISH